MSQKIVITANMKGPAESKVPTTTYQWHWRRIIIAAGIVLLLLSAFYGLISSVNAEQSDTDDTPSAVTKAVALDSNLEELELTSELKPELKATEQEPILAKSEQNDFLPSSQQNSSTVSEGDAVNPERVVQKSDLQTTTEIDEDEAVNAVEEASSSGEISMSSTTGTTQEQPLETNSEQSVKPSKQDDLEGFPQSAHVANVALGASINTEKVSRAVLTREVKNREPVNVFQADIRRSDFTKTLAFFSELKNLQGQHVQHIWYYQGEVVASIDLSVTTPRYRTYSNKSIMAEQIGEWRIDVVDEQGHLLAKKEFRILAN
ncbi:DUF2914 domain-containing protein [Pseudoalteromonas sp.]|uniref:DUF2914 domain-containing protein n=1 Tax=unclassified Pseudoalteromonas TaxID=194690 RepID=UPI003F956DCB